MKKVIVLLVVFYSVHAYAQVYNKSDIHAYIDTYSGVAVKKMQEHKIPASITLAQGILESAAGKSELAQNANNHFGIKCHSSWTGKKYHKDDDAKNECFRQYKSPIESFEDHSQFLKAARYADLFTLEITDYKKWAHGLKKAGYATHPEYAQRLIRIIEEYDLTKYDHANEALATAQTNRVNEHAQTKEPASAEKENIKKPISQKQENSRYRTQQGEQTSEFGNKKENYKHFYPVPYPYTLRAVYSNNGSYFIVAKRGDTFFSIAMDVQLGVGRLKSYNDVPNNRYEPVEGEMIYLQRKKPYAEKKHHVLGAGESLRDVAQQHGCRLKTIYKLNNSDNPETVFTEGSLLKLRK
jgi:hypothetical protein